MRQARALCRSHPATAIRRRMGIAPSCWWPNSMLVASAKTERLLLGRLMTLPKERGTGNVTAIRTKSRVNQQKVLSLEELAQVKDSGGLLVSGP